MAQTRGGKGNFSEEEIRCLLLEIASAKNDLLSKEQSGATNAKQNGIWKKITENVNLSNGRNERSQKSLKRKWKDLKCKASNFLKLQKMSGGVLPVKDFPHLELILSIAVDGSDAAEVAGKDRIDTQWNGSTPGISTDGPLDEPIQERDIKTEPAVDQTVRTPLVPVPDVAASSATVPKLVEDLDVSGLSSVFKHHLPSSSNVANASERKWRLVITPESNEEIVLFEQWMTTTIEKNTAKNKLLEAQKLKAILEVEKLKYDLGMWAS
uniref:Myb/SANT-like DNA-binding domain-containing protein n=1 Tax=Eptatretus burgeri TaxID=7764 RepID=A0A8C4QF70_EPTBU